MPTSQQSVKSVAKPKAIGHNFKYTGTRRVRRHISPPTIPRLERVHTPIEAQEIRRITIDRIGYVSPARNVQLQRIKSLKARRQLTLKPAPPPPTAPKSKLAKNIRSVFGVIAATLSRIDYVFLGTLLVISVIGILSVHSAAITFNSLRTDVMQIGTFVIGVGAIFVLSMLDYSEITRYTKIILGLNILLSIYTLIFGYSIVGDSNKNWINVFGVGVQPAEFSKVLFILSFATHLEAVQDKINEFKTVFFLGCHALLVIGLVFLQGDLGNSTVFIAIFISMCFAAKMSIWYFAGAAGIAVAASPFIWSKLALYQKQRILVGFNPDLDPLNKGYQAIRGRNAIASGGIFGNGYTHGYVTQQKNALPVKTSDMIFSTIGEEQGLIICALIVILYAVLIFRIVKIAGTSKDYSGAYICAGVAGMIAYQFTMNIGMNMGNLPIIGITLPLISAGGSSLIASYIALALVLSVHTNANKYAYRKI